MGGSHRPKRVAGLVALAALAALAATLSPGCVGYLTGSYDAEMQRMRAIVAELEAKNASLAEECIRLLERVRELEARGERAAEAEEPVVQGRTPPGGENAEADIR